MDADILTWFMLAEKPEWAAPLDICITVYLMLKADEGWKCAPKMADISRACGVVQHASVRKSLRRLEENKWVAVEFKAGIGLPNEYTVLVENLPRFDHQALARETHG